MLSRFSCDQLFATLWTVAHQAPLSMGFSRQEYWSGLPCPPPGDLPNRGSEPASPALQVNSLSGGPPGKPHMPVETPLSLCDNQTAPIPFTYSHSNCPLWGSIGLAWEHNCLGKEKPETQKEVIRPRTYPKLVLCQVSRLRRKRASGDLACWGLMERLHGR